jgi:hypothetical protein
VNNHLVAPFQIYGAANLLAFENISETLPDAFSIAMGPQPLFYIA